MVEYRNPGPVEFDARIVRNTEVPNSSAFVEFPFDVPELFGVAGRVPVVAQIDGERYQGSLMRMGQGPHLLGVLREIRERLGKRPGDSVHVRVELDEATRTVELAGDIEVGLEEAGMLEEFRRLSYSHQREYQRWIEEAKRPDTRARRIRGTTERIAEGRPLKA